MHGGVHCAVIESVASIAASLWLGDKGHVVGVNNNTDFLRASREGTLYAEANPVHRGGPSSCGPSPSPTSRTVSSRADRCACRTHRDVGARRQVTRADSARFA